MEPLLTRRTVYQPWTRRVGVLLSRNFVERDLVSILKSGRWEALMPRRIANILCFAGGILAASVQPSLGYNPPYVWAGAMAILSVTGQCSGRMSVGDTPHIAFRAKIQRSEPNSAITYQFSNASGIITKATTDAHFQGTGTYNGRFFTGRATEETNSGAYDLTVTPSTITAETEFITFTGSFTNFARAGCDVTVRGAAARRP